MLYDTNNTFRNTVCQISVDVLLNKTKIIGANQIQNVRLKKDLKTLKEVNENHAGQKPEIDVAKNWKIKQDSRAKKETKLARYLTK